MHGTTARCLVDLLVVQQLLSLQVKSVCPLVQIQVVLSVNRLLLTMSLPIMASMLVQALYNIVDSIFVAQISENALTAVSLAFPIQNLMIAVATGTGVGINAMLSKSLGEHDQKHVNLAASNGVFLALLSAAAFILFGIFCPRLFFASQTKIQEIIDMGTSYLTICSVFSRPHRLTVSS